MANELENTEFKQQEDDAVVGEDTRGLSLTHYVIAERLVALDCTYIIEDGHRYDDVEYLADKLSNGWRGYHSMSPGELWTDCLLYTSPSPRDATLSRMPSSA